MENIAVIYGGKSVEHDISIITAMQVMKNLSKKHNLIPVYIKQDGKMVTGENLSTPQVYLDYAKNVKKEREVVLLPGKGQLAIVGHNKIKQRFNIAAAILCNHGHGGEDGSLQGLLEMCEIPYSSPSVASSAICMDKGFTKNILAASGLETVAYVQISKCEYERNVRAGCELIKDFISFPCIVKPARLGSSVGISICEDEESLASCMEGAFLYDDRVIVEKYIENAKEYFCAVLNVSDKLIASKVDRADKDKMFTFEEKYLKKKSGDKKGVDEKFAQRVRDLAKEAYKALDCDGVVRVDFLYDEGKDILYINEVNTIPGSLAFNLFSTKFEDLLNGLIVSAKEKFARKKEIVYKFNSSAIEAYINLIQNEKMQK
ncbi:MAG: D-alanine--D-alanine ligase [Clostridia bacterium]|nr:D-alanine--D-alanine ligase [Clostridia bacterium]